MMKLPITALYYISFLQNWAHSLLADSSQHVSGGIILAPEGINGSICGTPVAVDKVLNFIQEDDRLKGLRMIQSPVTPEDEALHHGHTSHSPVGAGEDAPFRWDHVRVKLKKEVNLPTWFLLVGYCSDRIFNDETVQLSPAPWPFADSDFWRPRCNAN